LKRSALQKEKEELEFKLNKPIKKKVTFYDEVESNRGESNLSNLA